MAMTKNIRTTVNTISKLFTITNETNRLLHEVQTAKTAKESIESSKLLNNFSKRVDRLCEKLGFERDIVDEIFIISGGCVDMFVLHLLAINEYAFSAYNACASDDAGEVDGTAE